MGYLEAMRRTGRKSRLDSAAAYGLATGALPLLGMYPAMGLGCCGARSSDRRRLVSLMMIGHLAFGVGIGVDRTSAAPLSAADHHTKGMNCRRTWSRYCP